MGSNAVGAWQMVQIISLESRDWLAQVRPTLRRLQPQAQARTVACNGVLQLCNVPLLHCARCRQGCTQKKRGSLKQRFVLSYSCRHAASAGCCWFSLPLTEQKHAQLHQQQGQKEA